MQPRDGDDGSRRARPPARRGGPPRGKSGGPKTGTGRGAPKTREAKTREAKTREGGFGPFGPPGAAGDRTHRGDERAPDRSKPDRSKPDRRERNGGESARPRQTLRITGERATRSDRDATPKKRASRTSTTSPRTIRRRRRPPTDIETEVLRLGGKRGRFLLDQLMAGADAFAHDRDRETTRLLRPLRDALPDAPSVRELLGIAQYRLGNYRAAAKELEAFIALTDSVEQHPVLMDCWRAQRRWRRVDELWEELAATSPSAELVTEGRIVAAGALADHGQLDQAVALLERKAGDVKRPRTHHLRLWYALGDLEERSGNLARARSLFARVHRNDADFADVATRLKSLK